MKLFALTLFTFTTLTSAAMAMDPKELSTREMTIKERNAYYYEFDRDEQCQGYDWGVKSLGLDATCGRDDVTEVEPQAGSPTVLKEYIVYFDFDDSTIRSEDQSILRSAAREITRFNPDQVLIAGYTDTRGTPDYNRRLSASRADNVSDFLTDLGVNNNVVAERALGETDLAVATADEVAEQRNRRVRIQFVE